MAGTNQAVSSSLHSWPSVQGIQERAIGLPIVYGTTVVIIIKVAGAMAVPCKLLPLLLEITGDYWRLLEITGDY